MKTGTNDSIGPGLNPSCSCEPAVLEDEHEQPERGARREQVQQDRLDRDDDRAEGDEQQHERQASARTAITSGMPVGVEVDDVEGVGGVAA